MERTVTTETIDVTLEDARRAAHTLQGVVHRTPLLPLSRLSDELGVAVYAKPENLQRTGSFKFRGAYNRISALSPQERARSIITYSSGNHAQGVACAAALAGARAVVVMPEDAIPAKVLGTQEYGAQVLYCGLSSTERQVEAERLAAHHGYVIVPPFDDPMIVAGQATVGLEITADLPDVATVLVPIGGGGLSSGVAMAVKETAPTAQVIGVEPETSADAQQSLRAGHIVDLPGGETVADGLRARHIGALNFRLFQRYIDEIVTVSEASILDTVAYLHHQVKLVVEPSGAVTVAALRSAALPRATLRGPVVVILSGGNVDPALLCRLLVPPE